MVRGIIIIMNRLNFLIIIPRLVQNIGEGYQFPLGIAYISSSLKSENFNVSTLNLNHDEGTVFNLLKELITENKIDVVATGGISIQYNDIYEIFKVSKSINKNIITIAGGGIITAEPEIAMEALEYVDYGVIGEGEITICELGHALEKKSNIFHVNGIIFGNNSDYITTIKREEIENIDKIPWPDYEGFGLDEYLELPPPDVNNLGEKRLAFLLGSRSCPYNCTFCFHSSGKKYRQRSVESITSELRYLIEKFSIQFVFMADELFGHDKIRLKSFCEEMKKLKLPWRGSFRVDDIDEVTVKLLKHGNCKMIGLGLESADNKILRSMRKNITIQQTEKALELIYNENIPFTGNFIFGDIAETVQTASNTFDWWRQHPQYNINLWMLVTYPGSYLYRYARKNNLIKNPVNYLKEGCPAVNVSKLNDIEISWLVQNVLNLPFDRLNTIKSIKVLSKNRVTKRITFSGYCAKCDFENVWKDVKPFLSVSIICKKCSQKYTIPFPEELQRSIVKSIEIMLEKYNKIAMWGVTFHSILLFQKFLLFQDSSIVIIDNCSSKRMLNLKGKKIEAPSILEKEKIEAVVVFYPNSLQVISSQIYSLEQDIIKIIDICSLT